MADGAAGFVTEAIALRQVPTGESDRVLTLFTKDAGKLTAIAKAAAKSRRRFGGALAPFVIGEAALSERRGQDLFTLERFDARRDYTRLAEDPLRYAHGAYATELVRELVPARAPDPAAFVLLEALYAVVLDPGAAPSADTLRAFELQLLDSIGLRPVLDRCLGCGEPDPGRLDAPGTLFDPALGGVRCPRCAPGATQKGTRPLPAPARHRLIALSRLAALGDARPLPPLPADLVKRTREVMHALLATHLPGKLKTLDFIAQLVR
jgi:DNA repair protein RecO (recombination protein O)